MESIGNARVDGISERLLVARTLFLHRQMRRDILEDLLESSAVICRVPKKPPSRGKVYWTLGHWVSVKEEDQ